MKLLLAPVPIFVAAAFPQLPPELLDGAPAWVLALSVVAWAVLSGLNMIGRLPYKAGDGRPGFTRADRETAEAIARDLEAARVAAQKTYDLLAWKDDDGVPRFIRHVMETHAAVERQAAYVAEQKKLSRLIEDNHKLVGMVTDQMRQTNQRLDAIEGRGGAS